MMALTTSESWYHALPEQQMALLTSGCVVKLSVLQYDGPDHLGDVVTSGGGGGGGSSEAVGLLSTISLDDILGAGSEPAGGAAADGATDTTFPGPSTAFPLPLLDLSLPFQCRSWTFHCLSTAFRCG